MYIRYVMISLVILFCNLVCVYVHQICDKFGGYQIDAYGHDAETPARTCARGHRMTLHPSKTSRHRSVFYSNLKPLNIRILSSHGSLLSAVAYVYEGCH